VGRRGPPSSCVTVLQVLQGFFATFFFCELPMPSRRNLLAVAVWLLATGCASAGFDEGRSVKLATQLEELGFSTKAIKVRVSLPLFQAATCCANCTAWLGAVATGLVLFGSATFPDGPPEHSPSTFITTDGLSVVRLRRRE
jgi:hypothetical protein